MGEEMMMRKKGFTNCDELCKITETITFKFT
jgi:hypothetical protein